MSAAIKTQLKALAMALLFLAGALVVSLMVARMVFGLPREDIPAVGMLLAGAGGGGAVVALLLVRPAVLGRLGGVRAQLVGAGLVGSFILLGMVFAGARAMFISAHDFLIVLTMLVFAAILSVGFSLLCASPMARRIERVRSGTSQLAGGELDSKLPVEGHDELADLANDFNRMAAALEEASRREREAEGARRELIAAVSHDLRTPLASARALIEALADGVADDPETEARYLDSARGELEKLGGLVDDLFEVARIEAGVSRPELEETSLRDLLSDTLSSFQPRAQRGGVDLYGEVPSEADPVLASHTELQRILYNLLSNALQHTPEGGGVVVRAQAVGDDVRVEVSDTGEGIPPEDLPRVFERSFRGEKSRHRPESDGSSGAGLGLAIARGLVEAHGGLMDVESRPGEGACFSFTLQRARRQPTMEPAEI